MSYIDLINQFWRMNRIEPFTPTEMCLYFYLLNQWNIYRESKFTIKSSIMFVELKMTKRTIYEVRDRLKERGLISFTEGERRSSSPVYQIIENVDIGKQKAKAAPAMYEEELEGIDETPLLQDEEPEPQPKKLKKKEKSLDDLFKMPEPEKRKKKEFVPPTLQEVEDFFSGLGIQNAVDVAQQFFFHYDSLGWHTATGAVVHRWDSLANKWLLNDKKKEYENNRSSSKKGGEGDGYKQEIRNRFAEAERKFREKNGIV